ncbi:MAG TPA: TolC family protein [Longimicrobiaceae bacterium]|jgi:outer membrane protein TolC
MLADARVLLALALLLPSPLGGQAARGDSLGLLEAVNVALASSPRIESARQEVSASRGGVLVAGAPFDPQLRTFMGSTRESAFDVPGEGGAAADVLETTSTYGVSLAKRFRWGLTLAPELQGARLGGSAFGAGASNTARAGLGATLPLLRGRGRVGALGERAAEGSHRAALQGLRHAAAEATLAAVGAYWDYRAAAERLAVYVESEGRARRLVDETRVLVQAEERPPSDLNPLLANQGSRSATRIAAEQEVVEARHRLGLALGLPVGRIAALPPPASDFPAPAAGDTAAADAGALAALAAERRADLAAVREDRRSAELLLRGAEDGRRSRLDLVADVGYTGALPGDGVDRLFRPFYGSLSGWTAGVELSYAPGATDRAARGRAAQGRALLAQSDLAAAELLREVESAVRVAASAAAHARQELEISEGTAALYAASLESEKEKFRLGMSTLFEVLQAEDGLTGARVQRIGSRLRYAQAVARLRFESGTLLEWDGDAPRPGLEALVTVPRAGGT